MKYLSFKVFYFPYLLQVDHVSANIVWDAHRPGGVIIPSKAGADMSTK